MPYLEILYKLAGRHAIGLVLYVLPSKTARLMRRQ